MFQHSALPISVEVPGDIPDDFSDEDVVIIDNGSKDDNDLSQVPNINFGDTD